MTIESMTISGGYSIDIDTSSVCLTPSNQYLVEDEGGISIPILSKMVRTIVGLYSQLTITATSRIDGLLDLEDFRGDLQIQPLQDSSGSSMVDITVTDSADNYWSGSFLVDIQPVADPPSVQGSSTITVELGETLRIPLVITDPDTEELAITTSRSWANIEDSHLVLTPVVPGSSLLVITVGDGNHHIDIEINVIVRALPRLIIDDVSSFNDDLNQELPRYSD